MGKQGPPKLEAEDIVTLLDISGILNTIFQWSVKYGANENGKWLYRSFKEILRNKETCTKGI